MDDVQRLATLAKKSPEDVALATSRGSLYRHVRQLHNNGSTLEAIKTQLQGTFSDMGAPLWPDTGYLSQPKWHAYA